MKSISAWFDRHMKTRIALQLVLDGLPFICLIGMLGCACIVEQFELELLGNAAAVLMIIFVAGFVFSIPILFMAARFRQLAEVDFECYPLCKVPSSILRWLSFVVAVFSIPAIFGIISLWF